MRIDVDVSGFFSMDVGIVSIDGTICFFARLDVSVKDQILRKVFGTSARFVIM